MKNPVQTNCDTDDSSKSLASHEEVISTTFGRLYSLYELYENGLLLSKNMVQDIQKRLDEFDGIVIGLPVYLFIIL